MTRLRVEHDKNYTGVVVAELLEINPPSDTVRTIRSVSKQLGDGFASLKLQPTSEGQAYKVYLAPSQQNTVARYIQVPDQSWINIDDCVSVNPGSLTPVSGGGEDVEITWDSIAGKPPTFTPVNHTHTIGDVNGLQGALDGKQAKGDFATKAELNTGLGAKQDKGDFATKAELNTGLGAKQDKGDYATTQALADLAARVAALETPAG